MIIKFGQYRSSRIVSIEDFISNINMRYLSKRLRTYVVSGYDCINPKCDNVGEFFSLEKHRRDKSTKQHWNLRTRSGLMMTSDHVIPKSKGGSNSVMNRLPMCERCNGAKSNMTMEEFLSK